MDPSVVIDPSHSSGHSPRLRNAAVGYSTPSNLSDQYDEEHPSKTPPAQNCRRPGRDNCRYRADDSLSVRCGHSRPRNGYAPREKDDGLFQPLNTPVRIVSVMARFEKVVYFNYYRLNNRSQCYGKRTDDRIDQSGYKAHGPDDSSVSVQ